MSDAEIVQAIRELAGVGLLDARKAIEIGHSRLGGDMVAAAGYAAARGFAIFVRGDREAWNMDRGRARALVWRTDPTRSALIAKLDALSPIQEGPQPMTDTPEHQVDMCTGCSLIEGKAINPICYLEAESEDPETGFEVQCPNCETHIYGETPEAAVINWNQKQREVLENARRYLATIPAEADTEPPAPRF